MLCEGSTYVNAILNQWHDPSTSDNQSRQHYTGRELSLRDLHLYYTRSLYHRRAIQLHHQLRERHLLRQRHVREGVRSDQRERPRPVWLQLRRKSMGQTPVHEGDGDYQRPRPEPRGPGCPQTQVLRLQQGPATLVSLQTAGNTGQLLIY